MFWNLVIFYMTCSHAYCSPYLVVQMDFSIYLFILQSSDPFYRSIFWQILYLLYFQNFLVSKLPSMILACENTEYNFVPTTPFCPWNSLSLALCCSGTLSQWWNLTITANSRVVELQKCLCFFTNMFVNVITECILCPLRIACVCICVCVW